MIESSTKSRLPEAADFCETIMRSRRGGVVDDDGAVSVTELQAWVNQVRDCLTLAGIQSGEPVGVPIAARGEDVAAILGVILAGGVAVPVHVAAHADSVSQVRVATKARFEIKMPRRGGSMLPTLVSLAEAAPVPRELLRQAAMITFTSGSTGQPKGVVLSRSRLSAKFKSIQQRIAMPVGAVTAVPTMLRMLPDGPSSTAPVTVLTGGEAVSADLRRHLFARWQHARIFSIYGLTETGTCDVFHEDRATRVATDTHGRAAPGVLLRTDPQTSELQINTPFVMLGYLDMPLQTNATLANGWLHTGDLATISPAGEVSFLGRLKELINRAGNKISPLEVEALFCRHPGVGAALATGVADTRVGEAIHLLVVARPNSTLSAAQLRDLARPLIEPFKLPDRIHFAEALPLGRTGKADRSALREKIRAGQWT